MYLVTCENCKTLIHADDDLEFVYCGRCGTKNTVDRTLPYCKFCRRASESKESLFCSYCGAMFSTEFKELLPVNVVSPIQATCKCGRVMKFKDNADYVFCNYCGAKLLKSTSSSFFDFIVPFPVIERYQHLTFILDYSQITIDKFGQYRLITNSTNHNIVIAHNGLTIWGHEGTGTDRQKFVLRYDSESDELAVTKYAVGEGSSLPSLRTTDVRGSPETGE